MNQTFVFMISEIVFFFHYCNFKLIDVIKTMIIWKRDKTEKNDQLRHDWRAKHIDEIEWKNNNQCVY
jgi:hypothetical protein